ncbi:MAG TPA: hypothetical protein PLG15_04460 [Candidatus Gastranaerophilaceae bacterium]|nr:hypothetical protein [Candidatus Gastranaerophilaceae bacterium]HPT41619.1 hypothetical protein [Candidatus Gastranaerophilaceae bacterium]
MSEKIFKTDSKTAQKSKYFSMPRHDFVFQSRKNLIKNYILDPEVKLVK